MPEYLNRTATLKTATGLRGLGRGETLESLLREIHRRYRTVRQRRVQFEGQVVEAAHARQNEHGLWIHLVAYVPDDQISVVPQAGDRDSVDLVLADPPEGTEYADGDATFYIKGNDVSICRSGLSERALVSYAMGLGARLGHAHADVAFELMRRADGNKLQMIRREGVHKIALNALANEVTLGHIERTAGRESLRRRIVGRTVEELRAILGFEDDVPDEDEIENLKVEVLLSFDKRQGTELDHQQMEEIAERMLADDDDEGFQIITMSGRKIRPNDIVFSKALRLRSYGKSVAYTEAWAALQEFYSELRLPQRR